MTQPNQVVTMQLRHQSNTTGARPSWPQRVATTRKRGERDSSTSESQTPNRGLNFYLEAHTVPTVHAAVVGMARPVTT